jgi:hypothetical protein
MPAFPYGGPSGPPCDLLKRHPSPMFFQFLVVDTSVLYNVDKHGLSPQALSLSATVAARIGILVTRALHMTLIREGERGGVRARQARCKPLQSQRQTVCSTLLTLMKPRHRRLRAVAGPLDMAHVLYSEVRHWRVTKVYLKRLHPQRASLRTCPGAVRSCLVGHILERVP